MLHKIGSLSLKTKLFLLILIFFCIPSILIGMNWQSRSSQTIEKIAVDYDQLLVGQIQDRLDAYFKDLAKDLSPYLVHPLVTQYIYLAKGDTYGDFAIGQRLQKEVFPSLLFSRNEITRFSLISAEGPIVTSEGGFDPAERYRSVLNLLSDDSSFKVLNITWYNGKPIVTAAQKIVDASLSSAQGLFVIDIDLYELARFFGNIQLGQSGFIWIFGKDGEIIYHPDHGKISNRLEPAVRGNFGSSNGYFMSTIDREKKLIYYSQSSLTEWYIVSEVPFHELNGTLMVLRNTSIAFMLLLILLALVVGGIGSLTVTGSLLKLQRLMRRAEIGDLSVRAPGNRLFVEIDSLNQGFNRMIAELRRLIEVEHRAELREKEMEIKQQESMLRMMQSQINPHFLYNTLEVINSYAIVTDVLPISRMATALARIFRYSINHSSRRVTLQQELDYIRTYLSIHSERNLDFILDWDVDEHQAANVEAASLIIQPIVENAFIHGYDRYKLSADYIGIHGREEQSSYIVTISDRGGGIESAVMKQLNDVFLGTADPIIATEGRIPSDGGGIGLWNVHKRIQLTFGSNYGLWITKSDESGTDIEIRLPLK